MRDPARAAATARTAAQDTTPIPHVTSEQSGRPARRGAAAVLVAAVLAASVFVAVALTPAAVSVAAVPAPVQAPAVVPAPVRATTLVVPALNIRTDLIGLGVDAAGVLVPPDSPDVAGWFTSSAAPGDPGPSVVAGHVDSRAGPGIFFRLRDLRPGDTVDLGRSDGTTAHYRITTVVAVDKNAFPTEDVYGPTPGPEIRLITCGGEFDHTARRYLRDVIVSGVLVA